ncbi:hypothetical protein niasHS_009884 [Heterodera schachtii]|uniref:Uncharacterized protein n=1 Tax=Heterodera schachtii TaxID=97005 RepID=A0ABD2JD74_HETSC
MNPKIVLFLLLPLLIIDWVTPTKTLNEKRTNKGKGLQRSAEGSAFSAYKPQGKEEIKSPLSVKSAFRPYKQKDNGKNAENEQKNETDGQQQADRTGDNELLRVVAAENVDEQRADSTGDNELLRAAATGDSEQSQVVAAPVDDEQRVVATGDSEQLRVVAARDDDQQRAVSAGDVALQHVEAVAEPMEVSADRSRSAQTLKPSGGGDGSTSSRRKSGGHQSPLGRHEDAQQSSVATLSADMENAGNNGGTENDDHEMCEREGEAQKQTPMKRRLIKQKTMEKSSKRSAAEKKKNVDSLSMERSVNSNPFKSAEDAPSLASTSQNNLLEAQVKEQAAQIQKLTEVLNELQQKVNVGKEEAQQSTQPRAVSAAAAMGEQQQQLPMVQQQLTVTNSLQPQYAAPLLVAQHPQPFQAQSAQQLPLPVVQQQQPVGVHHLQPQNTAPFSVAQQPQPQTFAPVLDPSTRQHLVQVLQQQQMQQQAQHQFQLSPPLQRVNNPGLSINPVRMITAGQLIADRQQQQQRRRMQLQLQQQQHELMGSPPASRSSSPNQLNIEHLQQQQQRPQPAARLPTSYNLSPVSNARCAKEHLRKQKHDAGTSSGSVAGEVQQQWQQPQDDYAIDATPLRAFIPLREGQSNQVGTSGAGPSGYSGDQQQQIQHLRMSANVDGNLVESQRRHSRVEKAKQIAVNAVASDDNQINNVEKIVIQAISECIKKTLAKSGIEPEMFNLSLTSINESINKYLNFIQLNRDNPDDIISELRTFFQPNNGGGGGETPLIVQSLDEISMEIESFDSNGPSSSNSVSPVGRAAHHQKKRFLLANYRLYHKLLKLLSATAQQLKDGLREAPIRFQQLHKWVTAMVKGFRQILEKFEKQNGHDESVNWCSNLFRLEDAIESAKLALLIAFPPNSLNEWIKNGGKWKMLNDIVDEAKFKIFFDYYDDKASAERNFIDKIHKYSENEYYGMFSEFEVNYLRNLANQIAQNAFVVKPLTMQKNMYNLTITLAILQKIIAEIETNPNMFTLDSVKSDKEIATNFLHLCVSLLDAKFDHFQNQVLARLNEFDRIRKGILDGQGQSSKSK